MQIYMGAIYKGHPAKDRFSMGFSRPPPPGKPDVLYIWMAPDTLELFRSCPRSYTLFRGFSSGAASWYQHLLFKIIPMFLTGISNIFHYFIHYFSQSTAMQFRGFVALTFFIDDSQLRNKCMIHSYLTSMLQSKIQILLSLEILWASCILKFYY